MSFYLAWSIPHLFIVAFFVATASAAIAGYTKLKYGAYTFLVASLIVAGLAINVGQRQSELGRSNFDADVSASVEKVGVSRMTREDAAADFQNRVNQN